MSRNNDNTTGNLLDFAYFKENYRLIAIDLSTQTKLKDHNKLILLVNLKTKVMEQQCFLAWKNWKKLLLNFYKILETSYKNGNRKDWKFVRQFSK